MELNHNKNKVVFLSSALNNLYSANKSHCKVSCDIIEKINHEYAIKLKRITNSEVKRHIC